MASLTTTMVFVALLLCVVVSMEMILGVSASIDMNRSRKSVYTVKGRVPIIFANNQKNISPSNRRRNRLRRSSSGLMDYGNGNNREIDDVATVSSRSYTKYYSSNAYDDGYDDISEWDRLERIKKDLQSKLGGYRPWSVDTSSTRPGTYSWTTKLVLANVAFYALQMISPSITRFGAKRSELIMQGKELHRLITPVFLHGSVTHLMLNTFSLQNIGPEVERLFGGGRFLSTYLAAGVAGNLVSAYYSPNPSLGASGAVFGLMGAYYAFLSQNERILGRSGQNAMSRVSGTLAMNVLFGLSSPRIDNWAHIGGALGGATMAAAFGPKLSLLGLPNGGSIIVDKPSVRLPPSIESIPTNISKRFRRAKLRMQVDRYVSELTAKPWRKNRGRQKRFRMKKGPIRPRFEE